MDLLNSINTSIDSISEAVKSTSDVLANTSAVYIKATFGSLYNTFKCISPDLYKDENPDSGIGIGVSENGTVNIISNWF